LKFLKDIFTAGRRTGLKLKIQETLLKTQYISATMLEAQVLLDALSELNKWITAIQVEVTQVKLKIKGQTSIWEAPYAQSY
jgi:hypothetical protein